ncbi:MAG: hypothetical protein ACRBHB_17180 [Arenicella sp.]
MKKTNSYELNNVEIDDALMGYVSLKAGIKIESQEPPKVEFSVDAQKRVKAATITIQIDE